MEIRGYPELSKTFVYALSCEGIIFYVGLTTTGLRRPKEHFNPRVYLYQPASTRVYNFIRKRIQENKKMDILILEECKTRKEVIEAEIKWIKHYTKEGIDLTNCTPGGELKNQEFENEIKRVFEKRRIKIVRNDGEIFDSVTQAAQEIHSDPGAVYNVLIGKNNTVKGFDFTALDREDLKELKQENSRKRIGARDRCKIRVKDQYGTVYESLSEAARVTGVMVPNICNSLKGRRHNNRKYKFSLVEE